PPPAQPQLAAALRARRDLQLHRTLEGGRGHLRAFERFRCGDGQVEEQIAPLHPDGRMRPHRDAQVEIARNAAALSGAALAGEPHAGARLHAGRDLHLEPGRLGRAGLLQHDLALRAEDGIAQVHLDGSLDVVAGERLVARAPPAAAPTAEQIAEHRAEVGRVEARAARTASSEEVFESLEAAPSRAGARRLPVLAELARLGFVETAAQRDLAKLVEE